MLNPDNRLNPVNWLLNVSAIDMVKAAGVAVARGRRSACVADGVGAAAGCVGNVSGYVGSGRVAAGEPFSFR